MKKLIIFMIFCIFLTGCTAKKPVVTNKNLSIEEMPSEIFDFALSKLPDDSFYYIGSGITVTDVSDDGKVTSNDLALYPVYENEDIYAMVLKGSEMVYIDDLNVDEGQMRNGLVIANNENVFLINDGEEAIAVRVKSDKFNKKILEKIELSKNLKNEFGNERKLLKSSNTVTDPETGRKYSSSRLVVKFTDGDSDKKIADFEEFCHGKLKSTIKSIGLYVFEIEASNIKRLKYLVDQALQFDYVEAVHLDEHKNMDNNSISKSENQHEEQEMEYQNNVTDINDIVDVDTNTTEEDPA
ncbi:MAG: hypothetical protein IJG59_01885 [Erysipelotrichaceae bacterium]|nr:hypothetical protein [Erysipelotrichaceae bacterium]